jgi:hypothetical protein
LKSKHGLLPSPRNAFFLLLLIWIARKVGRKKDLYRFSLSYSYG